MTATTSPTVWFAPTALLPATTCGNPEQSSPTPDLSPARQRAGVRVAHDVMFEVSGTTFTAITEGATPPAGARTLPGVAIPGLANTHSHAFHRALRGRTQGGAGDFWTWRETMYQAAARLTPHRYEQLARAVYAEMALAGITSVGEFHYVHHDLDGTPYNPPHQMETALVQAAQAAGIRIALLDTLYLTGGLTSNGHLEPDPVQRRFSDKTAQAWAQRATGVARELAKPGHVVVGAAVHSVRAVPRQELPVVREWAHQQHLNTGMPVPVHAHVSEQPAENLACQQFYGTTPTQLLAEAGLLGEHFTAVHATHLTDADIDALGNTTSWAGFCPTTERDLADGIGPAAALVAAGAGLSLGTDQHALIDMFEEARAVELHERLVTNQRGRLGLAQLWESLTAHRSLGFAGVGALAVGQAADVVCVDVGSARTAGCAPEQLLFAASTADVVDVAVAGEFVVQNRTHRIGDVGQLLAESISELFGQ